MFGPSYFDGALVGFSESSWKQHLMQIGRLDFFQAIYFKGALLNGSEIKLLSLTLLFTTNEGTITVPEVGSTYTVRKVAF